MLFNSYEFLFVFLPITAVGFVLLGRLQKRLALGWLVACSLFYYGYWNPRYLWLIGVSIAGNYALGRLLSDLRSASLRKALLVTGVGLNLGMLGYYKYAGFLMETVNTVGGTALPVPAIVLPLAISFFTFQQIAYLVDAWRGETKEHRLTDYVLFVTFFPQLIAGPIVHHKEMLTQFARKTRMRFTADDAAVGIAIFVLGLFKKVVLADNVAGYANTVFDAAAAGSVPTVASAWIGVLAYTFQLYFDFSGYSDMAIGLGRLFGIKLPINFNSPYKAVNVIDFWRRWHITLSRFLRDYLYIALGGSRRGALRRYTNLMLTMLLGGLWHGAGWTFVLWGGLHGSYLCLNHAWASVCKSAGWTWTNSRAWRATSIGLTFLAVVAGWILFRATSVAAVNTLFAALVGAGGEAVELFRKPLEPLIVLALLAAVAFGFPNTQEFIGYGGPEEADAPGTGAGDAVAAGPRWRWQPSVTTGVVMSLLFVFAVTNMTKVREFLYFQF